MQRYVAILQQNPGNVDALYYVAMIASSRASSPKASR